MSMIIPSRIVLPSSPALSFCSVTISENATQTVTVGVMRCSTAVIRLSIAQNAEKTFVMQDAATVDYSGATEINFDVWDRATNVNLLSYSMTGGRITLSGDNKFAFTVEDSESGALTKGNKACEAWVTLSSGERRCVGKGTFRVEDTRKFDT